MNDLDLTTIILAIIGLLVALSASIVPIVTAVLQYKTKQLVDAAATLQAKTLETVDKVEVLVNSKSEKMEKMIAARDDKIDKLSAEIIRVSEGGSPTPTTIPAGSEPVTIGNGDTVSVEKPAEP